MINLKFSSAYLVCAAVLLQPAVAKELSAAAREEVLASLEKLKEGFESKASGKASPALAAFRTAMSSDEAAAALYLKCIEKVEFTDKKKKASDFREWRQKDCPNLTDLGFGRSLRHQLRWLTLTITANSVTADRTKLAVEAQEAMDALAADFSKLGAHQDMLYFSVTDSAFAKAYDFNRIQVPNWPLAPMDFDNVYNMIILPPFRNAAALSSLQAGWTKYIQQATARAAAAAGDKKKGSPSPETQAAAYQKFIGQEVPELRWKMEVDLFKVGDQEGSTTRMLGLLQSNLGHSSWAAWAGQFKTLIQPEVVPGQPTTTAPASEDNEE